MSKARLPSEIWNLVFVELSSLDLLRLAGANKYFRGLVFTCYTIKTRKVSDRIESFEEFKEIAATHYLTPSTGIVMVPWAYYYGRLGLEYINQRGLVLHSMGEVQESLNTAVDSLFDLWDGTNDRNFLSGPWKEDSIIEANYTEKDFPAVPQQHCDKHFYTMVDRARNAFLLILSNLDAETYIIAGTLIPKKVFAAFNLLDYSDCYDMRRAKPYRQTTLYHCLVDVANEKEILKSDIMLKGLPLPETIHSKITTQIDWWFRTYVAYDMTAEEKAAVYKKLEPQRNLLTKHV